MRGVPQVRVGLHRVQRWQEPADVARIKVYRNYNFGTAGRRPRSAAVTASSATSGWSRKPASSALTPSRARPRARRARFRRPGHRRPHSGSGEVHRMRAVPGCMPVADDLRWTLTLGRRPSASSVASACPPARPGRSSSCPGGTRRRTHLPRVAAFEDSRRAPRRTTADPATRSSDKSLTSRSRGGDRDGEVTVDGRARPSG